jgi:hypothetical protein
MSYNWQRAPYPWERYPIGTAVVAAMVGVGVTALWSLLI